ncbi:MAG: lamin tail domain-containing protein [Verrucomicrobiota bacterium]
MQGSDWLRPRYQPSSKFSYRLYFRGDYGLSDLSYPMFTNSTVQTFDQFVLRAGHNDQTNPFIKDEVMRRLHHDMGAVTSHGINVTLFINGRYKGYYNLTERIDKNFCQSYHGGGNNWDVIAQFGDPLDGDVIAWNSMKTIMNRSMTLRSNYEEAGRRLDLVNFVDYLLVNIFGCTMDWPNNNWRAARERVAGAKFRFYIWDAEGAFGTFGQSSSQNVLTDQLARSEEIPTFYKQLRNNFEFKLLFADRIQKHMFNNGALTTSNVHFRYRELKTNLLGVIPSMDQGILTWATQRRTPMLNHFRSAGISAWTNAPVFNQHGGPVSRGFPLSISAPAGTIYYTLDGSDPRVAFAGTPSSAAKVFSSGAPVLLNATTLVKARALAGTNWSAVTEALFQVAELGIPLRFTEIMYNPVPANRDEYEFIEIKNIGATAVDLSGMKLDGVSFVFPAGTMLDAGAVLVLSSDKNPAAFDARYPGLPVAGRFSGSLGNGGERLSLIASNGQTITAVQYRDSGLWPDKADGQGYSIEIIDPSGDPHDPINWQTREEGGSPGVVAPIIYFQPVQISELMAENVSAIELAGNHSDWLELHNASAVEADLSGWSLTDDGNPRKFVFPNGTRIPAEGYLMVWCDALSELPGLHAGFALDSSGESIALYDATGNRVDAISFGLQLPDLTLARFSGRWQLARPTPNQENEAVEMGAQAQLILNEWLPNPPSGSGDWIELYNRDLTRPVSLEGLYFTTPAAGTWQYRLPSFIGPGAYIQLHADEQFGGNHVDFKLPAAGGTIILSSDAGTEINRVTYGAIPEGLSEGRLPNGSTVITRFSTSISPGAPNYLANWTGPVLNELMADNESGLADESGQRSDWIEILNPLLQSFDLSGFSLSIDRPRAGQWTFPSGTTIPSGGFLLLRANGSRAPSIAAAANMNIGESLKREGGAVYLFDRLGQQVDAVLFGFQIPDRSIGRSSGSWQLLSSPTPGRANVGAAALGSTANLRLNEWMANPVRGNDWFEIYNPDLNPVSLTGLYLTEDPSMGGIAKFRVGPLSFIAPGNWVKFEADAEPERGPNHVNFSLNQYGETLRMYAATNSPIDFIDFGAQPPGTSEGRLPDGQSAVVRFADSPSPESSNYLVLTNIVINEILAHTDPPLEDAIELHNPTDAPVNVSGWFISNKADSLKRFRIPENTVIPARGYRVFYEAQFNPNGEVPPSFNLNSAHGGSLFVSATDANANLTGWRAQVDFGATENGVSLGRIESSIGAQFAPLLRRTFGRDDPPTLAEFRTGSGLANAGPKVGPIVISEIMYHAPAADGTSAEDPDFEFIEIQNVSGTTVPLFDPAHATNGWRLNDAIEFDFAEGQFFAPGAFALIVNFSPTNSAALAAFRLRYSVPQGVQIFGPFSGRLANDSDDLELLKPDAPQMPPRPDAGFVPYLLVEHVRYSHDAPWPIEADSAGASLQRINVNAFANDPVHWIAALPTAGRATAAPGLDTDQDGIPDSWEEAHGLDKRNPADAAEDSDGDGLVNRDEYESGTDPRDPASALRLVIVNAEAGMLRMELVIQNGRSYGIEYRDALTPGDWRRVEEIPPQPEPRTIGITVRIDQNSATRFYRVVTP